MPVVGRLGCGVCRPCLAGRPNVCLNDKAAAFGTAPDLPGGQAEAMAVPFADLFALPSLMVSPTRRPSS